MYKLRCNYNYSFDKCHTSTLYTNKIQNTQLFLKLRVTRKMRGKRSKGVAMTGINSAVTGKFSDPPVIMTAITSRFISRPDCTMFIHLVKLLMCKAGCLIILHSSRHTDGKLCQKNKHGVFPQNIQISMSLW